jgi:hypothetical protein
MRTMTRLVAMLPIVLAALAALVLAGCDGDDCVSDDARGNTIVSCPVTWSDQPVRPHGDAVATASGDAVATASGDAVATASAPPNAPSKFRGE